MKLSELLTSVDARSVHGPTDTEIEAIAYDSREIHSPNTLFVAIPGASADGLTFVPNAVKNGATVVVHGQVDPAHRPHHSTQVTYIEVPDTRRALAELSTKFYANPSRKLKLLGVTGTNGKTTTTYLIKHICDQAGLACGLLGTVSYQLGNGESMASVRTTPESTDLQRFLSRVIEVRSKAVAMEVSSHAIASQRIRGLEFDTAVFTNLTQDHLDFHGRMSDYFQAKADLFTKHLPAQKSKAGSAVVNFDDPYGSRLLDLLSMSLRTITYGYNVRADFRASNVAMGQNGTTFQLDAQNRSFLVRVPLIGKFNIYNSLAAIAATAAVGIPIRTSVNALRDSPSIPGRLQAIPHAPGFQVFVDYAHSDDALQNVLKTLRELKPRRLIVVFGCGGNRDRAKRPLMAKAVEAHADFAFITSDNPRREDPLRIIDDVAAGFVGKRFEIVPDRRRAIEQAIEGAEPGDIVLIAGKGHETYQELADETIPFNDAEIAQEVINTAARRILSN